MDFFLRFRAQLKRTRPELISRLKDVVVTAVKESGGKITKDHSAVHAVFDEDSPGIWIDILILVETLTRTAEENAVDLYGYSLLFRKNPLDTVEPLSRFLAGAKAGGGVFMDQGAAEAFRPYATFEENSGAGGLAVGSVKYGSEYFFKLKEIKIFIPTGTAGFSLREKFALPDNAPISAVLIIGQSLKGRRDELYRSISADNTLTPLFIRFGNGGLNALTDSWTEQFHALAYTDNSKEGSDMADEIAAIRKFLFRQRLRDTPSPFAVRTARRFFKLILTVYSSFAKQAGKTPAIIFENIHIAEKEAAEIVTDALQGRQEFSLLGLSAAETDSDGLPVILPNWKTLFPKVFRASGESPRSSMQDLPPDLWEIGYACALLGRYFPPDLFPSLFEEMGKSPAMISRSFALLFALKVTDTPLDPRPWREDFLSRAEAALGGRKETIKTLVRGRLLAWVEQKKINYCFRLLSALKELDGVGDIDDSLVLQSIQGEMIYGYEQDAGTDENTLTETGAKNRIPILRYILETSQALQSGDLEKVHTVFAEQAPDCTEFPKLKTQVLINQSLYRFSIREKEPALETAKEATLLCQGAGGPSLASSYRLLALASLSRKRISEAVNYLDFALENAVKSGNPQDIGMASFYSASVHLLHGNLSLSQKLIGRARTHFLEAGSPEWADKARFLEGRLAFETGAYQQSAEIFNDIRYNPSGEIYTEKDRTLAAWTYRAIIFSGKKAVRALRGGGFDADIFNLESCYLTGDIQTTDELFAIRESHRYNEEFYFTEKPDWRSGFAQSELLYFSWSEFQDRILGAYHALILSKIAPASGNEATGIIQNILRTGQYPEFDPSDIFLHFACYKILQQAGASQVDINTAVSIAFKRLQERAGKIDDPDTRRRFLTMTYWNGILTQAAKDSKLI